jgi:hypothetical protein
VNFDSGVILVRGKAVGITGTVEIVRSFSYKLNAEMYGGNRFESRDFFCSQKAQCDASDAEEIAELLHEFCKHVVLEDVRSYIRSIRERKEALDDRSATGKNFDRT